LRKTKVQINVEPQDEEWDITLDKKVDSEVELVTDEYNHI